MGIMTTSQDTLQPTRDIPVIPSTGRLDRCCEGDQELRLLVDRLIEVAKRGLALMFDPELGGFVHSVRRQVDGSLARTGESLRYGAIALLGIRLLSLDEQRSILGGQTARELGCRLGEQALRSNDLGAVSGCAWAAFELDLPEAKTVLQRALDLEASASNPYTVDLAWLGSALAASTESNIEASGQHVADRLVEEFRPHAQVFPHRMGEAVNGFRSHVASFADQVYPIQALSRLHHRFGMDRALEVAVACSDRICELQGGHGQWWWHYDVRTGAIVERYPVYSVHQDAMGPMCLLDVEEAGGPVYREAIRSSLRWMVESIELGHSLIDDEAGVIWRKVARIGPNKMMRAANAAASKLHEGLRFGLLGSALPPRSVDWECRPYHLGWVLHAWLSES